MPRSDRRTALRHDATDLSAGDTVASPGTPVADRRGEPEHRLRRRGLIAAVPAFGAVVGALAGAPARANPSSPDTGPAAALTTITINALRMLTDAPANPLVYVTDSGREGTFRYLPTDTSSADDGATVIVAPSSGLRFSRVHDGVLNVHWFGAKGDGSHDDTAALQQAIRTAQARQQPVFLPHGNYRVSAPLIIDSAKPPIAISGSGMSNNGTVIGVHSSVPEDKPIHSIFRFTDAARSSWFEFRDMFIMGTWKAEHGIYARQITRLYLHRVGFELTNTAGLAFGYGWNVTVSDCAFFNVRGYGILTVNSAINNLNIVDSYFVGVDGIAVNLSTNGHTIRITGCDMENVSIAPIVIRGSFEGVDITGNYFENNAKVGYRFATPSRTVKTQVLLNGASSGDIIDDTRPIGAVQITGNMASVGVDADPPALVAAYAVHGLEIANNSLVCSPSSTAGRPVSLIRTGTSATGTGSRIENIYAHGNTIGSASRPLLRLRNLIVDDRATGQSELHTVNIEGVVRTNYAPTLQEFRPLSRPGGAVWHRSTKKYRRYETYELSRGTVTPAWGFTINLAEYPELAGHYVYFACYISVSDTTIRPTMYTSQLGDLEMTQPSSVGTWQAVSIADLMPTAGIVSFGIKKHSQAASSILSMAHPVLSEVGVRFDAL